MEILPIPVQGTAEMPHPDQHTCAAGMPAPPLRSHRHLKNVLYIIRRCFASPRQDNLQYINIAARTAASLCSQPLFCGYSRVAYARNKRLRRLSR